MHAFTFIQQKLNLFLEKNDLWENFHQQHLPKEKKEIECELQLTNWNIYSNAFMPRKTFCKKKISHSLLFYPTKKIYLIIVCDFEMQTRTFTFKRRISLKNIIKSSKEINLTNSELKTHFRNNFQIYNNKQIF
jgi:hypothetical protein